MSSTPQFSSDGGPAHASKPEHDPPTRAAFPPTSLSHSPAGSRERASIIVQRKSPLLATTPPPITRVLVYSHPYILQLNKLAGLVSWSTDDPWQSFLLLISFLGVTLYGDAAIRWVGPLVAAAALVGSIYLRSNLLPLTRGSEQSTAVLARGKKQQQEEFAREDRKHYKSLDEIADTLQVFTTRCNILLEPLLRLIQCLSSPPVLTRVLLRLAVVTPVWIILALPVVGIITTKRLFIVVGTVVLTWHSRSARVSRAILWRSGTVRRMCAFITGLDLESFSPAEPTSAGRSGKHKTDGAAVALAAKSGRKASVTSTASKKNVKEDASVSISSSIDEAAIRLRPTGIRFTFSIWENQRRWLGLGWTNSLFAYERAPWTDEHLNMVPPKEEFQLPEVQDGSSAWRWAEDSEWRVEGALPGEEGGSGGGSRAATQGKGKGSGGGGGWIYCDGKWRDGRRGQDGWGRYTRRRKWYRDAELVEISAGPTSTQIESITGSDSRSQQSTAVAANAALQVPRDAATQQDLHENSVEPSEAGTDDAGSVRSKRQWFKRSSKASSIASSTVSAGEEARGFAVPGRSFAHDGVVDERDQDEHHPGIPHPSNGAGGWGVGDDARMSLS